MRSPFTKTIALTSTGILLSLITLFLTIYLSFPQAVFFFLPTGSLQLRSETGHISILAQLSSSHSQAIRSALIRLKSQELERMTIIEKLQSLSKLTKLTLRYPTLASGNLIAEEKISMTQPVTIVLVSENQGYGPYVGHNFHWGVDNQSLIIYLYLQRSILDPSLAFVLTQSFETFSHDGELQFTRETSFDDIFTPLNDLPELVKDQNS
jgi:hypothetical protein